MSVLDVARITVDPPDTFPVTHLSKSAIELYQRCPLLFRHRYIDRLPQSSSGKMVLGSAAASALAQHFAAQLETGEGLPTEAVLDEFDAGWRRRNDEEDVDLEGEDAGELKDSGVAALRLYHRVIAPTVTPIGVERDFTLSWPGVPFAVTGYIDLETDDNRLVDHKLTKQTYAAAKVSASLEPDLYLLARQAEGDPADGFDWHLMVRTKQPKVPIIEAPRDQSRLELMTGKIFTLAREIEWRWLNDVWAGPGQDLAWLCNGCPAAAGCPWRLQ